MNHQQFIGDTILKLRQILKVHEILHKMRTAEEVINTENGSNCVNDTL